MFVKKFILNVISKNKLIKCVFEHLLNKLTLNNNKLTIGNIHSIHNNISLNGINNLINISEDSIIRKNKIIVLGSNNLLRMDENSELYGDLSKKNNNIYIKGNNNKIIIGKKCILKNIYIFISGDNNTIVINDNCTATLVEMHLEQNDNQIRINNNSTLHGRDGYPIHMELDEKTMIMIEKDCMLSNGIQIRTTDSHSILNDKNERINLAENVTIGENCWICLGCILLKGTEISPHSIIGAGSICNKKYELPNCIIAGNPAKIVKHNVNWTRKQL